MKKLYLLFMVIVTSMFLASCQLAQEIEDDESEGDFGYYPVTMYFEVLDDETFEFIDISDYFYFSWQEGLTSLDFDYTASKYGESTTTENGLHVGVDIVDDEITRTIEVDLILYLTDVFAERTIYPNVIYMTEDGRTKTERQIGLQLAFYGNQWKSDYKWEIDDGNEHFVLDLSYSIFMFRETENVIVKEFDENDSVINSTTITKDNLLSSYESSENAAYIMIIENRIIDDVLEQERIYVDLSTPYFYQYKYSNEDGFLIGEHLSIT